MVPQAWQGIRRSLCNSYRMAALRLAMPPDQHDNPIRMAALAVGELGHATQLTNSYSSAATASPIFAGESATVTPASFKAAILDFAVPSPPLMMAPAWPMRLPGGAV